VSGFPENIIYIYLQRLKVSLKNLFYSASFTGMILDMSRGDIRYALSDPDFNKIV
jgi:hypothetical protein